MMAHRGWQWNGGSFRPGSWFHAGRLPSFVEDRPQPQQSAVPHEFPKPVHAEKSDSQKQGTSAPKTLLGRASACPGEPHSFRDLYSSYQCAFESVRFPRIVFGSAE